MNDETSIILNADNISVEVDRAQNHFCLCMHWWLSDWIDSSKLLNLLFFLLVRRLIGTLQATTFVGQDLDTYEQELLQLITIPNPWNHLYMKLRYDMIRPDKSSN